MDLTMFSQNVTINGFDYSLTVLKCAFDSYKIIITDGDKSWNGSFENNNNELDRLKSALREKDGMKYSISMIDDSLIKINVKHSLFTVSDEYELNIQIVDDISSQLNILTNKMKLIDSVQPPTTYPITLSMLGKGSKIGNCGLTNIKTLKRYLDFYISKIQFDQNNDVGETQLNLKVNKISPTNTTGNYPENIVIDDIQKYYKISYVYAEEKPVPTENSIVLDNLVIINEQIKCVKVTLASNTYTIITKRYQTDDHVVGLITKTKNIIIFEFCTDDDGSGKITHTITPLTGNKSSITKHNRDCIVIPLNEFFEQYIIALPFHVPDGLYRRYYEEYFLMIKNNKIYHNFHDLNVQNNTATCYVPSTSHGGGIFRIGSEIVLCISNE